MPRQSGFRLAVASVWLRLAALSIVGLLFAEALYFGGSRIQGWTFYLSTPEVFFEVWCGCFSALSWVLPLRPSAPAYLLLFSGISTRRVSG